jgi:hypothetical protein
MYAQNIKKYTGNNLILKLRISKAPITTVVNNFS